MELQLQGPCRRTCSSSTASSSAIQVPFLTACPLLPEAVTLLPPAARQRAPLGARAIASPCAALPQREATISLGKCPDHYGLSTGEWCVCGDMRNVGLGSDGLV
jgi:hypothetical protein